MSDKPSSNPVRVLIVTVIFLGALGAGGYFAWQNWFRAAKIEAIVVNIDPPAPPRPVQVPSVRFTDITAQSGIHFRHTNGSFGKKLLPETMGSGVAFLDYDNDGRQDLLFVNSCSWPGYEDKRQPAPTLALYRNKGDGTFEDVTTAAGLNITVYGMGVTVG